jgi:hypothetical protein
MPQLMKSPQDLMIQKQGQLKLLYQILTSLTKILKQEQIKDIHLITL